MPYPFNLQKHIKIWFSQESDCFLPALNQLRLVQYRLKNPDTALTLLYSSRCLNEEALSQLFEFCKKLSITPVDFDREVEATLTHEQDIRLYRLAQLEIEHCLADQSGNMGGASDCARAIAPVVAQYGFYHDFDNELELHGKTHIQLDTPIVFHVTLHQQSEVVRDRRYEYVSPQFSNELLMLAHAEDDDASIHPEALTILRNIQAQIIRNYDELKWDALKTNVWGTPTPLNQTPYNGLAQYMAQRHPEIEDIWDFRRIIAEDCILNPRVKEEILRYSVISISGPNALAGAFGHRAEDDYRVSLARDILSNKIPGPFAPFLTMHEHARPILERFQTRNEAINLQKPQTEEEYVGNVGKFCDLSWTPLGRRKMRAEESKHQAQLESALAQLPPKKKI